MARISEAWSRDPLKVAEAGETGLRRGAPPRGRAGATSRLAQAEGPLSLQQARASLWKGYSGERGVIGGRGGGCQWGAAQVLAPPLSRRVVSSSVSGFGFGIRSRRVSIWQAGRPHPRGYGQTGHGDSASVVGRRLRTGPDATYWTLSDGRERRDRFVSVLAITTSGVVVALSLHATLHATADGRKACAHQRLRL